MKTHILIAMIALIVTACASQREIANVPNESQQAQTEHAQLMDAAASARGNSVR